MFIEISWDEVRPALSQNDPLKLRVSPYKGALVESSLEEIYSIIRNNIDVQRAISCLYYYKYNIPCEREITNSAIIDKALSNDELRKIFKSIWVIYDESDEMISRQVNGLEDSAVLVFTDLLRRKEINEFLFHFEWKQKLKLTKCNDNESFRFFKYEDKDQMEESNPSFIKFKNDSYVKHLLSNGYGKVSYAGINVSAYTLEELNKDRYVQYLNYLCHKRNRQLYLFIENEDYFGVQFQSKYLRIMNL